MGLFTRYGTSSPIARITALQQLWPGLPYAATAFMSVADQLPRRAAGMPRSSRTDAMAGSADFVHRSKQPVIREVGWNGGERTPPLANKRDEL